MGARNCFIVAMGLAFGFLCACGAGDSKTAGVQSSDRKVAAPTGNATAAEVAEEARGDVDCPADIDTAARPANAPVDDVVGVRPGLTFEEAANVVLCSADLLVVSPAATRAFNIQTYGATVRQGFSARFAEERIEKTSQQIMKELQDEAMARSGNAVRADMKAGQAKWYVTTMGEPGKERVIAAAREEWFAQGRNPTVDSVAQALIQKYGTPTRRQGLPHLTMLSWVHDPAGQLVPETSPLANQCTAMSDPDGGTHFSPDCGVVVAAQVRPMQDNPAMAQLLQVGVADQAGGYQALTQTEQALEAAEMKRRAEQVNEAGNNADRPQL